VNVVAHEVANRVQRLADTLATLRLRVREAVAGETGRAVGDAVRELLAAAIDGRLATPRNRYQSQNWDDDRDTWREDDRVRRVVPESADEDDESSEPSKANAGRARRWSAAMAFAATTARCWATRRVPAWVVLTLGSLAGVAAWAGGHLARAGLALLDAVGDLFPPSEPASWGFQFF
jgi:hypothetical protein